MVCKAHSNKLSAPILKTIQQERQPLQLLPSPFAGPEKLVAWLSPLKVAELENVFESKY